MGAPSKKTPELLSAIIDDYVSGMSIDNICKKYDEYGTPTTIQRWIRLSGTSKRGGSGPSRSGCRECGELIYAKGLCDSHYKKELSEKLGRCNIESCNRHQVAKGMCELHYRRTRDGVPLIKEISWWVNVQGYVCEYLPGHIQANTDGRTLQHRRVMSDHLGRRLESYETVHHKDGDKLNNNIDNLELWSKLHPAGQRVEDLIEFANKILEKYID